MSSPSATQNMYPHRNEPIWSRSEKAITLHGVMQDAKQMASQIKESSDL